MAFRYHTPVMVGEVVEWLRPRPGSIIVDATTGSAGHALAITAKISPGGMLIGIDRDGDALEAAAARLSGCGADVKLVCGLMGNIGKILGGMEIAGVDAILADLGVSSLQLGTSSRGFSFMNDGPLDMRMDKSSGESVKELIARLDVDELENILREYGEERYARRIARAIASESAMMTTGQLARMVSNVYPPKARRGRIHPATRTFQALRMAVNNEVEELERFLNSAPDRLSIGGRLVVISYHSLEDRRVKHAFRKLATSGGFGLPSRRAIRPSANEITTNPRSRSAKLRILERV